MLGYDDKWSCRWLPTFQRNLLISPAGEVFYPEDENRIGLKSEDCSLSSKLCIIHALYLIILSLADAIYSVNVSVSGVRVT